MGEKQEQRREERERERCKKVGIFSFVTWGYVKKKREKKENIAKYEKKSIP